MLHLTIQGLFQKEHCVAAPHNPFTPSLKMRMPCCVSHREADLGAYLYNDIHPPKIAAWFWVELTSHLPLLSRNRLSDSQVLFFKYVNPHSKQRVYVHLT